MILRVRVYAKERYSMETINLAAGVGNRETIAATLTSAVHLHLLVMQMQGKPVTLSEAIDSVRETWMLFLQDEQLNKLINHTPTHLAPTVSNEAITDPLVAPAETLRQTTEPRFESPVNLPPIGLLLDERYRILKELGAGGMGKVFLAEQLSTGRKIAVKLMNALLTNKRKARSGFFARRLLPWLV